MALTPELAREQADKLEDSLYGKTIATTLAERNGTHGDFGDNGRIMQQLKATIRSFHRVGPASDTPFAPFFDLAPHQAEALDMIMHKVGRILCGDPNFADHWLDIEGYARLCRERCPK